MYKLLVKWFQGSQLEKVMNESQLREFIMNNTQSVRYAQVITPSGVTKEITEFLNK